MAVDQYDQRHGVVDHVTNTAPFLLPTVRGILEIETGSHSFFEALAT